MNPYKMNIWQLRKAARRNKRNKMAYERGSIAAWFDIEPEIRRVLRNRNVIP